LVLKFWMVSPKILALPIRVMTLSGVSSAVANIPSSLTVPVIPATVTKSPTLKGLSTIRKAPAAKFDSRPPQAAPMAMPMPATRAAKLVVSTPK
jgi:hypothetical protein